MQKVRREEKLVVSRSAIDRGRKAGAKATWGKEGEVGTGGVRIVRGADGRDREGGWLKSPRFPRVIYARFQRCRT